MLPRLQFFFFNFFGVCPLLFMDGHATIFFFFPRPLLFMDGVRPLLGLSFFGCGFVEVTKCYLITLLVVRLGYLVGRGLVEVTKCYLITFLVVHLGSWTC